MDLRTTIAELAKTLGTPKTRAAFGQWTSYAWLVRGLVEKGFGITTAVRHVLENTGFANSETSFGSLRAAYYRVKKLEWPAQAEPEPEEFE